MDADKIKAQKKEFRVYLRMVEGKHGTILNSLISASEGCLPLYIKTKYLPNFISLYDEQNDIKLLMQAYVLMQKDKNHIAEKGGYIVPMCLNLYIKFYCAKNNMNYEDLTIYATKEIEDCINDSEKEILVEGTAKELTGIRYERNSKARKRCLEYYGCKCYVCGIDMSKEYGTELGKDAIEVHHIIPISQRCSSYIIDPIHDLRPLCPNCHCIVHRKPNDILDIEKLKTTYNRLHNADICNSQ